MRICPSCEAENDDGSRFCTNCHDYLDWAGGKRVVPTRAPPFEAPPPPIEPPRSEGPGRVESPPASPAEAASEPVLPPAVPTVLAVPAVAGVRVPAVREPVTAHALPAPEHSLLRRIPTTMRDLAPGSGLVARPPEVASGLGLRAARITPVRPDQQPVLVPARSAPVVTRDEPEIPGGQVCKVCRRSSPPQRRFCPCGATLMRREAVVASERRAGTDRPRSVKGFRAGLRAAAGGRSKFDRPVALRVRATRFLLVVVVVALVGSQFISRGAHARHWTVAHAKALVPKNLAAVSLTSADVDPRKGEIDNYEPGFAIDGEQSRAWAVHVKTAAKAGRCGSATSPALIIKIKGAASVDRIVLHAGLPDSDDNRARFQIPRLVDVTFSDGTCSRLRLEKSNGEQDFPAAVGAVESMRIQVAAVYPAVEGAGGTAAIAEVALEQG